MTTIILAIVIGAAFGFVLDRIGATNPGYIISMLRLGNLHLMKTILLAIGVSSLLMFTGLMVGLIDPGHLDIKTAYQEKPQQIWFSTLGVNPLTTERTSLERERSSHHKPIMPSVMHTIRRGHKDGAAITLFF